VEKVKITSITEFSNIFICMTDTESWIINTFYIEAPFKKKLGKNCERTHTFYVLTTVMSSHLKVVKLNGYIYINKNSNYTMKGYNTQRYKKSINP